MIPSDFEKQISFLLEIDKVKTIFRQTRLLDNSRNENDAEHSWHIALMAMVLEPYANSKNLDILRVLKMVLLHDIVEIDAGDVYLYDDALMTQKKEKETKAAKRIFGILPTDQQNEFIALWEEFEKKETPEACFAASLDRLEPLLQNYNTNGFAWKKHGVTSDRVYKKNEHIANGSQVIWEYVKDLIDKAVIEGKLEK